MFAIVQHADSNPVLQKKALPLLKKAALNGKAQSSWLAALEERLLVSSGKAQLYGTQLIRSKDGKWLPAKIQDESNVDKRRATVGLYSLKHYLYSFNKSK